MKKGSTHTPESLEKIRKAKIGQKYGPCPEDRKEKIRQATLGKKKNITSHNPSWFTKGVDTGNGFKKGHKSWNEGKLLTDSRMGKKYKLWRKSVLERDANQCVKCGSICRLHAHHVKKWKDYPELRFDLENGQTLCNSCHSKEEGLTLENINKDQQFKKGHNGHRTKKNTA